MSRLIRWVIRLYPRSWRERYASEFDTFLEDVNPRWRDIGDIARGAIRMQIATWNPGKITVALAILGSAIAAVTALCIPDTYLSTAVLKAAQTELSDGDVANLVHKTMTRSALMKIIEDKNLYEADRAVKPLEDVVEKMRRSITMSKGWISKGKRNPAFMVEFTYPNQWKAQQATGDLVSLLQQTASPTMPLEVLDAASLPKTPIYPNRLTIILVGLACGVLLGAMIAGLRRMLRPRAAWLS
jgi:capsular polysaccharide biosynthesis protein